MKVFVWEEICQCATRYHHEGGVVVFAESETRAREIANACPGCAIDPTEHPNDIREVAGGEEAVYIMPNAGCC
jgi:hypothetical protein